MRIAVLGSTENWHYRDLMRAASGKHELVATPFSRIRSRISSASVEVSSANHDLSDFDAVLVRTMPPGSLEQVVFRMDALARLEAAGVRVLNPPRAIEAAVDKYLATTRLKEAGLLVPRTFVCQSAADALEALDQLGGKAVLKPIFGGEGRGVTLLEHQRRAGGANPLVIPRELEQLEHQGDVIYLQEFIDHNGADLRLLVIGENVLGMRRRNPDDWRTNISRGAQAEPLEVTDELASLARRAAAAVGAPLAGVDLLPSRDGGLYAIEVNASPGWRALTRVTGVDVAQEVLRLPTL